MGQVGCFEPQIQVVATVHGVEVTSSSASLGRIASCCELASFVYSLFMSRGDWIAVHLQSVEVSSLGMIVVTCSEGVSFRHTVTCISLDLVRDGLVAWGSSIECGLCDV